MPIVAILGANSCSTNICADKPQWGKGEQQSIVSLRFTMKEFER